MKKNKPILVVMNTILLATTKRVIFTASLGHAHKPSTSIVAFAHTRTRTRTRNPVLFHKPRTFTSSTRALRKSDLSSHQDTIKTYRLTGHGRRGSTDIRTNTNHAIRTDIPLSMGGENTAPQPVEHLLAAFIGCTQATAIFVGRNMKPRILIDRIEFDIEAERDERGALDCLPILPNPLDDEDDDDHHDNAAFPSVPARLQCIKGSIIVHAKNRKGEKIKIGDEAMRLLEIHTEKRCPVANMIVNSGCSMHVKWVDGGI